jgi:DNA ligase-1
MEVFIDSSFENSLNLITIPLGIHGNVVYPQKNTAVRKQGDDIYVPDMKDKFMLADKIFKMNEPVIITPRTSDYHYLKELSINQPPIGWYMSEKFDGQRAIWDGAKFVTRGSTSNEPRVYPYVPKWFIAIMPPGIPLDGEFFISRGKFSETTSILKTKLKTELERKKNDKYRIDLDKRWSFIKYQIFDIPSDEPFETRLEKLNFIIKERYKVWDLIDLPPYLKKHKCPLIITKQYLIKSFDQLNEYYDQLVSNEAEGVMIRAPKIPYLPKRTKLMLKLKPEEEDECLIIGYIPGKGQFEGLLGSFNCRLIKDQNKYFNVGGMKRSIRTNYNKKNSDEYHPIGTIITFKYTEMTPDGIPRFPRYKGIRYD